MFQCSLLFHAPSPSCRLCGAVALALFVYLAMGDCRPNPYGLFIFYIFGSLLLQLLVLTVEWCMFVISKTGGIMQMHLRRSLIGWLVIRFVLVLVEAGMSVVGGYTAWSEVTLNEPCFRNGVHFAIIAFTVVTWVAVIVACVCFGMLLDPFSCYSPATITHVEDLMADDDIPDIANGEGYNLEARVLKVKRSVRHLGAKKKEYVVNESGKKLYNPNTKHLWTKSLNKVKCSCCKQEGHEHQSTMETIAQDLAILFDGESYVVSDLVAALVLTMEEQQPYYDCLTKSLRKVSCMIILVYCDGGLSLAAHTLGGWNEFWVYGMSDVDLCGRGGGIVCPFNGCILIYEKGK